MKKHLLQIAALMLAIPLMTGLAGCATSGQTRPSAQAESASIAAQISDVDRKDTWDDASSTTVSLGGASITVEGPGAAANGGVLTISSAGTYVVSGTLTAGQIVIDAGKNDLVHLVLNGATIVNPTGAPIYAPQCDKLILTLAAGTENVVTDGGANFVYANATEEEPNAALFSKDDLTINGTGTLTVNAGYHNGIGTKDDLLVVGGTLIVNAANHGLRGNDSVTILDGDFTITAGNDGMQTSNAEKADQGGILIEGGTFEIVSAHDGIQAEAGLTITGGTFSITAGSGASRAASVASADTTSDSFKGLKAVGDLLISGGSFTIDSYDDCVHANGNVTVTGGAFALSTADDGMHADQDLTVDADITISTSYEGLEGTNVTLLGGTIYIVASNDGINAAGGGDTNGGGGRFGADRFAAQPTSTDAYYINISGGDITVVAGEDGIDSNGVVNVSGGHIVSLINAGGGMGMGGGMGGNGGVDPDGAFTVTGGTIIYGGSSIGVNPGADSTQSYVYLSASIPAGTEVTVEKNGKTLAAFTSPISCQVLEITAPDIISGESYDVFSNGGLLATVTAGTGGGMGMGMGGGQDGGRGGWKQPRN